MKEKYCKLYIVGGSCSGKSTLLAELRAQGYTVARNFTTRKRRLNEGAEEYYFIDTIDKIDLTQLVYVVKYYQGYYGLAEGEFLRSDVVTASTTAMANILAWLTAESIIKGMNLPEILESSTIYLLDGDLEEGERYNRAVRRDGKEEADRRFLSESFTHSYAYLEKWFEYATVIRYKA